MVGRELHDDGAPTATRCSKPSTASSSPGDGGDVEAIALAVPTDALDRTPAGLARGNLRRRQAIFRRGPNGRLEARRSRGSAKARSSWKRYKADRHTTPRLAIEDGKRALGELARAIAARDSTGRGHCRDRRRSVGGSTSSSSTCPFHNEIDRERFDLWARQKVIVDSLAGGDLGGVTGDVATMELTRDRFANALDPVELTTIDTALTELQASIVDEDLAAAREQAAGLLR